MSASDADARFQARVREVMDDPNRPRALGFILKAAEAYRHEKAAEEVQSKVYFGRCEFHASRTWLHAEGARCDCPCHDLNPRPRSSPRSSTH